MYDYDTLRVNQEGKVMIAFLDRRDVGNAINMRMVNDLRDLIDKVEDNTEVRVLVLRGSPDVFCSGIDLRDFAGGNRRNIYGFRKWERMSRELERLNKVTLAAVQGECTGGGFQLALLCDGRIAEQGAVFRLNEIRSGFLPGMATFRLAKYIGIGRAKDVLLAGRQLCADEALEWGILDRVCDPSSFEQTVSETVDDLLSLDPNVLEMARRLLEESYATSYDDFLGHFLAAQDRAVKSEAFGRLITKGFS
jgi:enoyl-CoA hydratase/carnithine racemase